MNADYKNLREALCKNGDMASGRAVSLLDAIEGTSITLGSQSLLNDLEKEATGNINIKQFLESLTGWTTGNKHTASEQLNMIMAPIHHYLITTTGTGTTVGLTEQRNLR